MKSKGFNGNIWELRNIDGTPVEKGQILHLVREGRETETFKVDSGEAPHKESSSGRVYVYRQRGVETSGARMWTEMSSGLFPHVLGLKWHDMGAAERPNRRPLNSIIKDILKIAVVHRSNQSKHPPMWVTYSWPYLTFFQTYDSLASIPEHSDGHMELLRLISNLASWRGDEARALKAELQLHLEN